MVTAQSTVAYKHVADSLRKQILSGELVSGERVLFARRIDLLEDVPVAFDEVYLPEPSADRFTSYYRNDLFRLISTIRLQVPSEEDLQ